MIRDKKDDDKGVNQERWLVSYGDFLTLLLAVFVVLYAISEMSRKKAEDVSESMRGAFGMVDAGGAVRNPAVLDGGSGVIPQLVHRPVAQAASIPARNMRSVAGEGEFRTIKHTLEAYLLKKGVNDRVKVEITRRGLVISLQEAGFFDSGSAVMKNGSNEVIGAIAGSLRHYANRCRVEGHTDNVPISTERFDSNWDLSTARATYLVKKLVQDHGLDASGISAAGYAEFQPVADNSTAEGRARNRRVDIVLMSSPEEQSEPQHLSQR